ncbi:MAG: MBL fold metallo-hydrolase [Euryarchaeota archaeon]|nr:MBL fold metallo-hydrolase [Euryarchaeota archaeon]MEC7704019.1 MBL fold metallo-hydrolase [Candidatus Thermoplasmatota archaeon]|tara:strand:- start:475 stop:1299 length:825 start_codon:yes stop_codon:yes gene_type:complete
MATRTKVGMSLEITHLGSGSRGNSTLLQSGESKVLVDCGFSGKQIEKRLARIGVQPESIDAILLTHHHTDHAKGAEIFQRRHGAKIFANFTTCANIGLDPVNQCKLFESLERVQVTQDISVLPVPVPHDDAENVGFIINSGTGKRAAIVTDLGEPTDELIRHLKGCAHISVEANYDAKRLALGPYPESLKTRIAGRGGHLSNLQTSLLLEEVLSEQTKSVVLCHLSEKNNAPHIAESEVLFRLDNWSGDLRISTRNGPEFSHWIGQEEAELITL